MGTQLRALLIARQLAVVALLVAGGCSAPTENVQAPAPTATAKPVEPAETPCDKAARQRARVPDLLARGKLDRTLRVLRHAATLCPASAADSWAPLVTTLAEVGRYDEARKLADEIDAAANATEEARLAAKTARALVTERDQEFANTDAAKERMRGFFSEAEMALTLAEAGGDRAQAQKARDRFLDAWKAWRPNGQALYGAARMTRLLGDEAGAQRLFDRAVFELETYAQRHLGMADARLTLDTPNGLAGDAVAWSPRGPLVAIAGQSGVVVLHTRTWREKYRLPLFATDFAGGALAFSPDGRWLVTTSVSNVRFWDADSGTLLRTVALESVGAIFGLAFSPDGKTLAVGGSEKVIDLFDVDTGARRSLAGHTDMVRSVRFGPKGDVLASASDDRTIRLWPLTGKGKPVVLGSHDQKASGVAFSHDGALLASAGEDGVIRLWDLRTRKPVRVIPAGLFPRLLEFTRDDKAIVSNGGEWLHEVSTGKPLQATPAGERSIVRFAMSPDGEVIASLDDGLTLWKVATGERLRIVGKRHAADVTSVGFVPTSGRLLAARRDGTIDVWDMRAGARLEPLQTHTYLRGFAISPDGRWLASVETLGREVHLRTLTGDVTKTLVGHESSVEHVLFSPLGDMLVSASLDKTVRLWGMPGGELLQKIDVGDYVRGLSFSPDGQTLAISAGFIRLWDVRGGRVRRRFGEHTNQIAYDREGARIFAASGGSVTLWDVARGFALESFTDPGEGMTWSLGPQGPTADGTMSLLRVFALSADNTMFAESSQTIATGASQDGKLKEKSDQLRLVDAATGKLLRSLAGHTGSIDSIAFDPTSSFLASGSGDGSAGIWSTKDGRVLMTRAVAGTGAWYVFSPGSDARIELSGDEARQYPVCRVGPLSYEFDLCAERFEEPGLAKKFLASDLSYLDP